MSSSFKFWNFLVDSCVCSSLFQLYDLIKSRVECDDFLEKIESAQVSAPQHLAGDDLNVSSFVLLNATTFMFFLSF